MLGTAHCHAADSLHAEVIVRHQIDSDFYEVEVISGVGGWDKPGKVLMVRASILGEITPADADAPAPAPVEAAEEPAPLSEPISADAYIGVLLARQAAYVARSFPDGTSLPPLEWFIRTEDEAFVILPERAPAAKRERTPCVYRSAASLREERDDVQRRIDAFDDGTVPDRAAANLSPNARSRAAARAGRRRFGRMDRDLVRFTALVRRRDALNHRIALAEAREERAARKLDEPS